MTAPRARSKKQADLRLVEDAPVARVGTKRSHALTREVIRAAALDKLEASTAPLLVIHAPAGFGKTTLLQQYCDRREAQGAKTAWIHFETRLTDPGPMLELLYDQFGFETQSTGRSIRDFVSRLESLSDGAIIIFDDFDRALSAALKTFFMQLTPILPDTVRIFVASRSLPALQLPRLRLREQVEVLTEEDLRFSLKETLEFFSDRSEAHDIAELHQLTDGWAAALQCYRLRGGGSLLNQRVAETGVTQEIIDFLAADVFETLAPDLQKQLLRVCLPRRLSGALVDRLLELRDGEGHQFLLELERSGLFLNKIDGSPGFFRFHGVFRQYLISELKSQYPAQTLETLHDTIGQFMLEEGSEDVALLHFIEANNLDLAISTFSRAVGRFVADERLGLVVHCAEKLPARIVTSDPAVFYSVLVAYSFRREFQKAEKLLHTRETALHKQGAEDEAWGLFYSAQMFFYVARDQIPEMGAACEKVGELLDESYGFQYAVSLNAMAYWWIAQSRFEEARAILLRARSLHEQSHSFFGQAYQEGLSASILIAKARFSEARENLLKAARAHDQSGAGASTGGSVMDAYLAAALYETGHVRDAKALLEHSSEMLEQQAIVDPLALKFVIQARLAMLEGDARGAEAILERAICLGHRHGLRALVDTAYLEMARHATVAGDFAKAEINLADHDAAIMRSDLLVLASEAEGHTVTRARLLVHQGDHAAARKLLIPAMREAQKLDRKRRLMKLKLISALSLQDEGEAAAARRNLLEALDIAAMGGALRSVLDEGPRMMRLVRETRQALPDFDDELRRDAIITKLDQLIAADGGVMVPFGEDEAFEDAETGEHLTPKERMILDLVNRGFSNQQLSERLSISYNTVKWHLRNIYAKLGVQNRMHAVSVARHLGLID